MMHTSLYIYTFMHCICMYRSSGDSLRYGLLIHGASQDPQILLNNMAGPELDPKYFIENMH